MFTGSVWKKLYSTSASGLGEGEITATLLVGKSGPMAGALPSSSRRWPRAFRKSPGQRGRSRGRSSSRKKRARLVPPRRYTQGYSFTSDTSLSYSL